MGSAANAAGSTLSATSRPRFASRARYTSPYTARADLGGNLIHPETGAWCEGHAWNRRDYTGLPGRTAISRERRSGYLFVRRHAKAGPLRVLRG
jgi:hypothetical protein